MKKNDEKTLKSQLVYQGSFLRIAQDLVETSDGKRRKREYILHPGASVIVPVTKEGNLVLERQYRHALKREFLEFPAGKLDPGEDPLTAAKRELKEETGFETSHWKRLGVIHPCIGYSDEFIEVFAAWDLEQTGAKLDDGEELEVLTMSRDDFNEQIRQGLVTDAKTLSAWMLFNPPSAGRPVPEPRL